MFRSLIRHHTLAALTILAMSCGAARAAADAAIALVIGNSAYSHVGPYPSASASADSVFETLSKLGFNTTLLINPEPTELLDQIVKFGEEASKAERAVIYYGGYAIDLQGVPHLLPVDARIEEDVAAAPRAFVPLPLLTLAAAPASVHSVILIDVASPESMHDFGDVDSRSLRPASSNQTIVFAKEPSHIAHDGGTTTTAFADALANATTEAESSVSVVTRRLQQALLQLTRRSAFVWASASDAQFAVRSIEDPVSEPQEVVLGACCYEREVFSESHEQFAREALVWLSIRESASPNAFSEFIERFPGSPLASLAEERLRELDGSELSATDGEELQGWATRVFAGPDQFPPEDFRIYGVVAFTARATGQAGIARHIAICRAWAAVLPSAEIDGAELPPREWQMATVWPTLSNEVADKLNGDLSPCEEAVSNYGLVQALKALRSAEASGFEVDGRGPYLLAWSPPSSIGRPQAVVLVFDLSDVETHSEAADVFRQWRDDIEGDPALWNQGDGWNLERLRVALRRWADRYGPSLLRLVNG